MISVGPAARHHWSPFSAVGCRGRRWRL